MSINYSFKHHYNWPLPNPSAPLTSGTSVPHFNPGSAGMHYNHPGMYGGYGGYGYGRGFRRFGLFRRFFWFGIGAGVATWYIHRKERQRQFLESNGIGQDSWGGRWHAWHRDWHNYENHKPLPSPPVTAAEHVRAVPVDFTSAQPLPSPSPAAQPAITPVQSAQPVQPVQPVQEALEKEHPRWGWRARREARQASINTGLPAPTASTPSTAPHASSNTVAEDELNNLKETVEKLWAEKKREALEAQNKAKEDARLYAKDKVERLSLALESLRKSLESEQAAEEKKLV